MHVGRGYGSSVQTPDMAVQHCGLYGTLRMDLHNWPPLRLLLSES